MKIAFVGKGGSGKSSVSWLATKYLIESGSQVLAIDADHNMDFAHLLGQSVDDSFPTLHRAHDTFRTVVHQEADTHWHQIVLDGRTLPCFRLNPMDTFTASVSTQIDDILTLMVVGLGAGDVLFSQRCAHGHSAPLKYYLPLLHTDTNQAALIDGVAGVDMMNFGLFVGTDAIVVVVEPHQNSIRVFREIARIAEQSGLPLFALINKADQTTPHTELTAEIGDRLLGTLPVDSGMQTYDYNAVSTHTKETIGTALTNLQSRTQTTSIHLSRLRKFEERRRGLTVHT
jgi:CO dehydrogenase nickel-insertion accessory protein CooC1